MDGEHGGEASESTPEEVVGKVNLGFVASDGSVRGPGRSSRGRVRGVVYAICALLIMVGALVYILVYAFQVAGG